MAIPAPTTTTNAPETAATVEVGKVSGEWVGCGEAEGEAVGFSEGLRVVEGEGVGVGVLVR